MTVDVRPAPSTVPIWDLHGTAPLADAWANWEGFVLLHPGEHSRMPLPFIATKDMGFIDWFSIQHRVAALMSQNVLYAIPQSLGQDERGAQACRIGHYKIDNLLKQVVQLHESLLI